MKTLVCTGLALTVLLAAVAGCSKAKPDRSRSSRHANEDAMARYDDSGMPRQSYEDLKLFQEQDELRQMYLSLLGIDADKAVALSRQARDACDRAFVAYKAQYELTNGVVDVRQQKLFYLQFLSRYRPGPGDTNFPPSFMQIWEGQSSFKEAEGFFRARMVTAGVPPRRALQALLLASRHRRAMMRVEWLLYPDMQPNAGSHDPDDLFSAPDSGRHSDLQREAEKRSLQKDADRTRSVAAQLLNSYDPTSGKTPCSLALTAIAREALANSIAAGRQENDLVSQDWAWDALETAKSAAALYELEQRTVDNPHNSQPAGAELCPLVTKP